MEEKEITKESFFQVHKGKKRRNEKNKKNDICDICFYPMSDVGVIFGPMMNTDLCTQQGICTT
jgi:hypothetical protein